MRLCEFTQYYYHGSNTELPVDTILTPRNTYEDDWGSTDFYHVLEQYRPEDMLSHKDAVFMVDNEDDVDNAGGGTEWLFTVAPIGKVEQHDLNWGSEVSLLISQGYNASHVMVEDAAQNYWSGERHMNESVWEYLTPKARILKVEKY